MNFTIKIDISPDFCKAVSGLADSVGCLASALGYQKNQKIALGAVETVNEAIQDIQTKNKKEQNKPLNINQNDLIQLFNFYMNQGDRFENIEKLENILANFNDYNGKTVTKIQKLRHEDYAAVYKNVQAAFEGKGKK